MLIKNFEIVDEQVLWKCFLEGNKNAYEYVYRKYIKELIRYGMRFSTDRELVKDCIQDVFIKIYTNRNNLKHIENIKLYLFISLKNTLFNAYEKDKTLYYIDTIEPVFTVEGSVEEDYITSELIHEEKQKINRIIESLTPRQKEVMYYYYIEGFSLKQICEIMNMNYQSVQNLIQRSIKRVQTIFNEKEGETFNKRKRLLY